MSEINKYNLIGLLGHNKGWVKVCEIKTDKNLDKKTDYITDEILKPPYLKFKLMPTFKTTEEPVIAYFNESTTPNKLKSHWERWYKVRKNAIKAINEKMAKYCIKKKDLES